MAHMSNSELAKRRMRNLKDQRAKNEQKEHEKINNMSETERAKYLKEKSSKSIRTKASNIIWDFDHNQVPKIKRPKYLEILNDRLKEIGDKTFFEKEKEKIKKILRQYNG
jgi:hypothetical protein